MLGAPTAETGARGFTHSPFASPWLKVGPASRWNIRREPTMRTRLHLIAVVLCALLLVLTRNASAAPEAHILRIDPRASQTEGAPVLTTIIELVQNKRL